MLLPVMLPMDQFFVVTVIAMDGNFFLKGRVFSTELRNLLYKSTSLREGTKAF